jgi:ribosomal protein L11 methyltransferase
METYIKIAIAFADNLVSDMLIAQLSECGFDGFEEGPDSLNAFINEEKFSVENLEKIISANGVAYTKTVILPKNWNEEWEKNFEPVTIENFCGIRASFHPPLAEEEHEIIITPKMSFGTGHHATTYLMIKAISTIDCKDKAVLDFGTGTGVLAILAEKCGAKKITAIDNDDWSIDNANENIKENGCTKIIIQKNDSIKQAGSFDIILANINKNILLQHFGSFKQHLNEGGVLLLSGLLSTDLSDIECEAYINNFYLHNKLEKESWICVILSKSSKPTLS